VQEPERTYLAAVSGADLQVGRVLQVRDDFELSERAMVIFSSDNGPEKHRDIVGEK